VLPHAEVRRVEVQVSVPRTVPRPLADRDRLMQVLANLAGNAVRFAGAGGRVTLAATCDTDAVSITVSDTGPGVSEAELPHVFDPYWRAPRNASSAGAGLGLTIARWLVEAHAGRITAERARGGGLSVVFTVPFGGGVVFPDATRPLAARGDHLASVSRSG
jgi:signal transduction histidine kinase